MVNHHLALATLLAVAPFTPTDAFVEIFPEGTTTASRGRYSEGNRFDPRNNGILKKLRSAVAKSSPATSGLFLFEESEDHDYEGVILDATQTDEQWSIVNEEWMGSSHLMAQADALQDSKASTVEIKATDAAPENAPEISTVTTSEPSTSASASPSSPATQSIGRGALSAISTAPGFSAGASIGTVTLGGLAVARNVLSQRQKKLDEEQRSLEEQQKRLQSEAEKLQKDTSQSNFLLVSFTLNQVYARFGSSNVVYVDLDVANVG